MALDVFELPDGTRVVLDHRPGSGHNTTVTLALEGSAADPLRKRGATHMLDHILTSTAAGAFQTRDEFLRAVERKLAGSIYAETDTECMLLTVRSSNQVARELIEIVRTQLCENHILHGTDEFGELEDVRKNVIHEIREERKEPQYLREELFRAELMRGTQHARPNVFGTIATAETITTRDLQRQFRRLMERRRALVVSGGYHLPFVRDALRDLAIGVPAKNLAPASRIPDGPGRAVVRRIHTPDEYVYARLGWRTVQRRHDDAYPFYLLADYLASGFTARLATEVVDERGLAYGLNGAHFTYDDVAGSFVINVEMPPKNVERVAQSIASVVSTVADIDLGDEELGDLKRRSREEHFREIDTDETRAQWFAHQALFYPDDIRDIDAFHELLAPIRSEDLRRVAREYLVPERFIGILVGPVDDEMKLRALSRRNPEAAGGG